MKTAKDLTIEQQQRIIIDLSKQVDSLRQELQMYYKNESTTNNEITFKSSDTLQPIKQLAKEWLQKAVTTTTNKLLKEFTKFD
jgi:glutamate racemase